MSSSDEPLQLPTSAPLPVVEGLQTLLSYCEARSREFHEDIDRFGARCAKNRVRSWIAKFLAYRQQETVFDSTALEVMNVLLANRGSIQESIAAISLILDGVDTEVLCDETKGQFLRLRADLPALAHSLDERQPFACKSSTIARAIAMGIDEVYTDRVELLFQSTWPFEELIGHVNLQPGDLFPSRRLSKEEIQKYFGPPDYNLAHIEDDAGRLSSIHRMRHTPLQVTLSVGRQSRDVERLLVQKEGLVVGFACLGPMGAFTGSAGPASQATHIIHQMNPAYSFADEFGEGLPGHTGVKRMGTFFDVSYCNQTVLLKIFEEACGKVDILIYPELALSAQTEEEIIQRMRNVTCKAPPSLVILGSRHVVTQPSQQRANRLLALEPKTTIQMMHQKIGTFGFLSPKDDCYYVEDISRNRELTFFTCNGMPVAFAICKDVLQASVIDTLQSMSVRQLIVVAMSPHTDEFIHHLVELAVRNNTRTFFACFAAKGGVTAGVFAPVKNATAVLLRNADHHNSTQSQNPSQHHASGARANGPIPRTSTRENAELIHGPSLAYLACPFPAILKKDGAAAKPHSGSDESTPTMVDESDSPYVTNRWFTIVPVSD